MKTLNILKIALFLVIMVLAYFLVETIAEPIRFEKEKAVRYAQVIERLKMIRTAEVAHRDVKGAFTADWNELLDFVKNGEMRVIKVIGNPDDSLDIIAGITYDTLMVSVADSFFRNYPIDSLPYIPFTKGKQFSLQAGQITKGNIKVNVFLAEDTAPFDPRKVLRVGSMEDANLSGNWE
ncbi:MAG: hypothetical protein Q8J69_08450 [Sphingobacteriaceae bacterium]|nr:hypothetical protein [Sphingobacteriaceae bacterium]